MSDHGLFSFDEGQQGKANGQDFLGFLRDGQGSGWLDAGSRVESTSLRPPPSWSSAFQFSIFLYNVWP